MIYVLAGLCEFLFIFLFTLICTVPIVVGIASAVVLLSWFFQRDYDIVNSHYTHATIMELFHQGYTVKQVVAQMVVIDRVPKRMAQERVELAIDNYFMLRKKYVLRGKK